MLQFKVNDKYDFELENSSDIDISALSETKFHILKDHKSYELEVLATDFNNNKFSIKVNGNVYEVKAKDELEQLLSKMGIDSSASSKVNELKAPMPGAVVAVSVKVGQEVVKGDALLILEAMKMENVLKAEGVGVVGAILISEGDVVDKGTVLIEFI